jgi:hypothetical protein
MTNAKDKMAGTAENVRPYVERALRDDELRENVRNAYASGRAIYEQLAKRRSVTGAATRLATDQKIQTELRKAVEELREAADRMQNVKRREAESHGGRNFFLLVTGIALGALFNPVTGPPLRRLLGDKLLGRSGDGFTYQDSNGKAGS